MTAPVVGSGSCPAWMQRVEKSSWFLWVITGPYDLRSRASSDALCPAMTRERISPSNRNAKIVDEVETGCHAEKLVAVHHDGDIVLAEQGQEIGDRRIGGNRLQTPHHHVFDGPGKRLVRIVALGEQRGEYVA